MKTSKKNTIVKLVKETLELKAGSVVALDLKAGQSLNVASGRLWLTRSGDSHDYWLRPGNQLVFGAATSVLAEADRDSRFELRSTGAELDLSWLRIAAQKNCCNGHNSACRMACRNPRRSPAMGCRSNAERMVARRRHTDSDTALCQVSVALSIASSPCNAPAQTSHAPSRYTTSSSSVTDSVTANTST
ncbi:DUF2917 domain-containing protein [Undibacterium arcticum]